MEIQESEKKGSTGGVFTPNSKRKTSKKDPGGFKRTKAKEIRKKFPQYVRSGNGAPKPQNTANKNKRRKKSSVIL